MHGGLSDAKGALMGDTDVRGTLMQGGHLKLKWAGLDEVQGQISVPVQPWTYTHFFLLQLYIL